METNYIDYLRYKKKENHFNVLMGGKDENMTYTGVGSCQHKKSRLIELIIEGKKRRILCSSYYFG